MKKNPLLILTLLCLTSFAVGQNNDINTRKMNAWFTTKVVTSVASYTPLALANAGAVPVLITSLGIGIVDLIAPFKMDSYAQLAQGKGTYGQTNMVSDYRRRYRRLFWVGAGVSFVTSFLPPEIILYEETSQSGSMTFSQQVTFQPINAVVNTIFDIATIAVMSQQKKGVLTNLSQLDYDFQVVRKEDVDTYRLTVSFPI